MKTLHGYPVIDDDFAPAVHADGFGTGYDSRDYAAFPLNGQSYNRAPTTARLSEQELLELIIEKTAKKSWLTDLADAAGSQVKNQQSSSYCWIHAPTRAMELARLHTGGTPLVLSAFYAGSQIKHGRNEGGSGITGVKWLHEHGTCVESLWPPMKFKGQVTPEITRNAELHQITIFEDFEPDDRIGIWSAVALDEAVTVGIPAWGHEVVLTALTLKNPAKPDLKDVREVFDNSWDVDWGNHGRGVLEGAKRKFDEAGRVAAMEMSVQ